jgi:hypothetical protein
MCHSLEFWSDEDSTNCRSTKRKEPPVFYSRSISLSNKRWLKHTYRALFKSSGLNLIRAVSRTGSFSMKKKWEELRGSRTYGRWTSLSRDCRHAANERRRPIDGKSGNSPGSRDVHGWLPSGFIPSIFDFRFSVQQQQLKHLQSARRVWWGPNETNFCRSKHRH